MKNIQRTALNSSFLTGDKADWKRPKEATQNAAGPQKRSTPRLQSEDKLRGPGPGASRLQSSQWGAAPRSAGTPCRPRGLHREGASSTRCPTSLQRSKMAPERCQRAPERQRWSERRTSCRSVSHWISGGRGQTRVASEEKEASQFPRSDEVHYTLRSTSSRTNEINPLFDILQ